MQLQFTDYILLIFIVAGKTKHVSLLTMME